MVDYTNILHGDLDDAAAITTLVGMSNLGDHVEYGLSVNADYSTPPGTISVSEGKAYALVETQPAPGVGHDKHRCLLVSHLDARSGRELVTTGVNYVWVDCGIDPNATPEIRITETDTAPSDSSLKIAEVDTSDETETPANPNPDGSFEDLSGEDVSIGNSVTWPDGETTDSHPISYGEPIDNRNDYYDATADNPSPVAHADTADSADHAETAANATNADLAADSDRLDGYTADQLLDEATQRTAKPWEPLLDQPYEKDNYSDPVDFQFRTGDPYDRYRVRLYTENDNNWIDALHLRLNGIDSENYRHINLTASEYLDDHEQYNEVRYTRGDYWTVGDTMARSHALQEFYLACPRPIVGDGAPRRYPSINAGEHHTGTIRQYHLTGNLTVDVDAIDEISITSDHDGMAIRVQVYGQEF